MNQMPMAGVNPTYKTHLQRKHRIAKLGSGARFKAIKKSAVAGGAVNPAAVAAAAGFKKYGKKKMLALARAGKK